MVRGLIELGSIACVVAVISTAAPIVACRCNFQQGGLRFIAKRIVDDGNRLLVGVVAEGKCAEPNFVDIGIEVIRRALGKAENQGGVIPATAPTLHIELQLDQALQQGGIVTHVDVVLALDAEGGAITEQLNPFAAVVTHLHASHTIVAVAVVVHTGVVVMRHNLVEGTHMRGHGIVAFGAVMCRVTDEVAMHGHHIQVAFNVAGHLKAVTESRGLVARLRHTDRHIETAETAWCPETIIITIVRIVGIFSLKADFFSVNTRRDVGELDDFGVFDIGRDDNHHWVNLIKIHFGSFVRTTDLYFRLVSIRIHDLEGLHHIRSRQPVGIAGLGGLQLHDARLTCQSQNVAVDGSRTFHHLKADGQSRRGGGHKGDGVIEN